MVMIVFGFSLCGFIGVYGVSAVLTTRLVRKIFRGSSDISVNAINCLMTIGASAVATIAASSTFLMIGAAICSVLGLSIESGNEPFGPALFLHFVLIGYILFPLGLMFYYLVHPPETSTVHLPNAHIPPKDDLQRPTIKERIWTFGLIFLPFLFCWRTLRKGYSSQTRAFAFLWAVVCGILFYRIVIPFLLREAGSVHGCRSVFPEDNNHCFAELAMKTKDIKKCPNVLCLIEVSNVTKLASQCGDVEILWPKLTPLATDKEKRIYSNYTANCWSRFPLDQGHEAYCKKSSEADNGAAMLVAECFNPPWNRWVSPSSGRNLFLIAMAESNNNFNVLNLYSHLEHLPKADFDLTASDKHANTAAHLLSNCDFANFLVKTGQNWKSTNSLGDLPIHSFVHNDALRCISDEFLELMIEEGLDLNAKDKDGRTVLHLILLSKETIHRTKIPFLIKKGANPDLPDNRGLTARQLALQMKLDLEAPAL